MSLTVDVFCNYIFSFLNKEKNLEQKADPLMGPNPLWLEQKMREGEADSK